MGSPVTPKRLKGAPMPPKRSPRDQKCLPKSSKTAPKIKKKRYLQLPESLDPSQNHIISNCLLKVFNHPIIKLSNRPIIQSSSHRVIKSLSNCTIMISRIIELSSRQFIPVCILPVAFLSIRVSLHACILYRVAFGL